MIGRLVQSADFQRLLATPLRARSAHFAVHHLAAGPSRPNRASVHLSSTELSTDAETLPDALVDRSLVGHWLGAVIPKRHAKRSVTRNLLRRQIRAVMTEQLHTLPAGLWLVRLRTPFAKADFVSAASDRLRLTARVELQQAFTQAGQPPVVRRGA